MSDISISVQGQEIDVSVSETDVNVDVSQQPIEVVVQGGLGPPGPPGRDGLDGLNSDAQPTVIWDQQVASSHWIIIHIWPGFPSVTIVDTSGNVITGDVKYITPTRIEVFFTSDGNPVEISGKAYLN